MQIDPLSFVGKVVVDVLGVEFVEGVFCAGKFFAISDDWIRGGRIIFLESAPVVFAAFFVAAFVCGVSDEERKQQCVGFCRHFEFITENRFFPCDIFERRAIDNDFPALVRDFEFLNFGGEWLEYYEEGKAK